jgi:hypothetical protein
LVGKVLKKGRLIEEVAAGKALPLWRAVMLLESSMEAGGNYPRRWRYSFLVLSFSALLHKLSLGTDHPNLQYRTVYFQETNPKIISNGFNSFRNHFPKRNVSYRCPAAFHGVLTVSCFVFHAQGQSPVPLSKHSSSENLLLLAQECKETSGCQSFIEPMASRPAWAGWRNKRRFSHRSVSPVGSSVRKG